MPDLVQHVRRTQRRRLFATAGVAAAAALAVGLGSLAVTGAFDEEPTPAAARPSATPAPASKTMISVGHAPVHGSLAFTSVLWGTRLDLTCSYSGGGEYGTPPPQTYVMFIRTRDGGVEQVATWRGLPGRTMRLAAATAASPQDITSVEVRTTGGKPVLKLTA